MQIGGKGRRQVSARRPQRSLRVLYRQPILSNVQRLGRQQRDNITPEATVSGRLRHTERGEQVLLSQRLLIGVVRADASKGCKTADGPEELATDCVVIGITKEWRRYVMEHGDEPRAGRHATHPPIHFLI